jgi:hypothetical protein
MSDPDRIVLACKILYDHTRNDRVLELRRELEAERLKVFWYSHSVSNLRGAMKYFNWNGPRCCCLACTVAGRKDEEDPVVDGACTFRPAFEAVLQQLGITWASGNGQHADAPEFQSAYLIDEEVHLANDGRGNWDFPGLGKRLWGARTTRDPEIQRFATLLQTLTTDL